MLVPLEAVVPPPTVPSAPAAAPAPAAPTAPGSAVPAFTCYTFEQASGVVRAAEHGRRPVCLLLSPAAFGASDGRRLAAMLVALARQSTTEVAVQLDHADDLGAMRAALDLGVTGLMADGSALPFADNVALVSAAVRLAGPYGASVEAELGGVAGDEDRATAAVATGVTDPGEAARFVAATGVGLLAVAIGNVHGRYRSVPSLDFARLGEIARQVTAGLSLHGTSGLPDATVRRAIDGGVVKVNVNTDLRRAYYDRLHDGVPGTTDGWDLLTLSRQLADGTEAEAARHLALCAGRETAAGGGGIRGGGTSR